MEDIIKLLKELKDEVKQIRDEFNNLKQHNEKYYVNMDNEFYSELNGLYQSKSFLEEKISKYNDKVKHEYMVYLDYEDKTIRYLYKDRPFCDAGWKGDVIGNITN